MEQHHELFASLAAPFTNDEVRLRPQGTRQIQYITARTVMNRLDDVLGPANWWDDYVPQENSVICRLTIRLPDGTTLTKCDAGGYAGMSDQGDDDKSGFSDAFKRAAVKFGIGRYLYRDGVPRFVQEQAHRPERHGEIETAVQRDRAAAASVPPSNAVSPGQASRAVDGQIKPRTGKALFAWIKQQDEARDLGLLKTVSDWAALQAFPARMLQWNSEQVQQAFAEALTHLKSSDASGAKKKRLNGAPVKTQRLEEE